MGLTSSKTIIPIKEADVKLGPVLRMKLNKVRVHRVCLEGCKVVCADCCLVHTEVRLQTIAVALPPMRTPGKLRER